MYLFSDPFVPFPLPCMGAVFEASSIWLTNGLGHLLFLWSDKNLNNGHTWWHLITALIVFTPFLIVYALSFYLSATDLMSGCLVWSLGNTFDACIAWLMNFWWYNLPFVVFNRCHFQCCPDSCINLFSGMSQCFQEVGYISQPFLDPVAMCSIASSDISWWLSSHPNKGSISLFVALKVQWFW
jgi:hypothetical protein